MEEPLAVMVVDAPFQVRVLLCSLPGAFMAVRGPWRSLVFDVAVLVRCVGAR